MQPTSGNFENIKSCRRFISFGPLQFCIVSSYLSSAGSCAFKKTSTGNSTPRIKEDQQQQQQHNSLKNLDKKLFKKERKNSSRPRCDPPFPHCPKCHPLGYIISSYVCVCVCVYNILGPRKAQRVYHKKNSHKIKNRTRPPRITVRRRLAPPPT